MKQVSINELQAELHSGSAITFSFVKKDGTTRDAVGTLSENLIPKEHLAKDDLNNSVSSNLKYYDLEKNGWRSLATDCSIINIK